MIAIGLGASYSESHLARLLDVEIALVLLPSGPTWTKFPTSVCSEGQIGTDPGSLRLLVGVEGCKNIGRGHCGSGRESPDSAAPGWRGWSSAPCPALICTLPSRALGAGLRNRHGLRARRRREACDRCGDQRASRSGARDGWVVVSSGISDLYSTRHPAARHFIVLSTKGDIVFRENSCTESTFGAGP